jgi:calcium permeable stress-gated cation channel
VGCSITWPVLFPVNATGGPTNPPQEQLDILSFSNIDTSQSSGKNRLYAHTFIGWIFFGFILFTICRETIFYINLRQAFLLSPIYAGRISSKTVLFTSVPAPYLDEVKLHKVFGPAVKRIWITGDSTEIDELVEKRDEIAYRLESAEVKLIKLANAERLKAMKKSGVTNNGEAPTADADAEPGSIAARWVPPNKRPTHKLGKFGLYGAKVDTINWCREQLETLIPEVDAAQAKYRAGDFKKIPAVFIEFNTQSEAQAAYQTLSHHQALHMSPRYIGVNPGEVVWKSLRISWWQKVIRRYLVLGFITALIVFWAIPVTFVGLISNITYLETYSWLAWLEDVPKVIMGVISGLLPSVMLAILMSLVPVVMRRASPYFYSFLCTNLTSLCQTRRRTHSSPCRALYAECVLRLPSHSGLPRHNPRFWCFGPGPADIRPATQHAEPPRAEPA